MMSDDKRRDSSPEDDSLWEDLLQNVYDEMQNDAQDTPPPESRPVRPPSAEERFGGKESSPSAEKPESGHIPLDRRESGPGKRASHTAEKESVPRESAGAEGESMEETRVISPEELEGMTGKRPRKKKQRRKRTKEKQPKGKRNEALGCLKSIVYVVLVLAIACGMAYVAYIAFVDVTGIGRNTMMIDITVPEGASTQTVAELLRSEDVIEQPLLFRVYCRLLHKDGTFHSGTHTVAANMGYSELCEKLAEMQARETVNVTIPEGSTIDTIAQLLEENNVCPATDFYTAVVTGNYEDYDFIAEIGPEQRKDRVYLLEGYLFPDTYQFYEECSPETAVRVMLDGFANRINAETRAAIKQSGHTLDEVVIEASMVQREAHFEADMPRVMRVLANRMASPDFPRLQFDSTRDYLSNLVPSGSGGNVVDTAYDTYEREGLPVGAICNPGLAAINAVLNPSDEPEIVNCYYFASIIETGETQFFETYAEHEAWCREHGVGMYG